MKTKFKAILIDPVTETFTDVVVDLTRNKGYTNDIHRKIECETFTISTYDGADSTSDTIFVDDNGLLNMNSKTKFFHFIDATCIFVGKGLILGTTEDGDSADVKHDIAFYKKQITFHNLKEACIMFPYVRKYYESK